MRKLDARRQRVADYINLVAVPFGGDDCLTWPFSRCGKGYGRFKWDYKEHVASRYICEIVHGPPPSERHEAAHSCGKGHEGCVNPRHLRWASHRENMAEARTVHRSMDAFVGRKKLTAMQVRQIREMGGALSHRQIASRFGIAHRSVQRVLDRTHWAQI